MAYVIKIEEWVNSVGADQKKTVRAILEHMKEIKGVDMYSNYAPHLDFSKPQSRSAVGKALDSILTYCAQEELPLLSFLVVRASTNLPGEGMEKWYEKKFNTVDGFDEFCKLHAKLAKNMLQRGLIVIK